MVRKIKTSSKINNFAQMVEELEAKNEELKFEITKRGVKIKQLQGKIEKLDEKNKKLELELEGNFEEKATRTEKKLLEIIEKANKNNEKLTVVELSLRAGISRQSIYRDYKHILQRLWILQEIPV